MLSNDCLLGNRVASVVREIVFHKCGLDLIPLSKICLDCVCPFPALLEEAFLRDTVVFLFHQNPKFDLILFLSPQVEQLSTARSAGAEMT